jgi:hypothetical protein
VDFCEFGREFRDGSVFQDALEVRISGRARVPHFPDTLLERTRRDVSPFIDDGALEKCIRVHDTSVTLKNNHFGLVLKANFHVLKYPGYSPVP